MFASVKPWINMPFEIKPFIGFNEYGDKEFGESESKLCYRVDKTEQIKDIRGVDVISDTQLYINGSEEISELSVVVLCGREWNIQKISTYFKDGVPSLKVVYL
jgi:hypothetical protein